MGKGRVAPVQPLTIPHLELQGAVTSARLALNVAEELKQTVATFTFWTDSITVLRWLKSKTARYQTFVANRVSEKLETIASSQWRHIPGVVNPADDVSRGVCPSQFNNAHRWFSGPEFLYLPEERWPRDRW